MRVRVDAHRRALRSEAVEKAPRADHGQIPLRECAGHVHTAHSAERHLARLEGQQSGPVAVGSTFLGDRRVGVEPGHPWGAVPCGQAMLSPFTSCFCR